MEAPLSPPPTLPRPRWHDRSQSWVAEVGAPYTARSGRERRHSVYFYGIPDDDPAGARAAAAAYLAQPEGERKPPRQLPVALSQAQLALLRSHLSRWYENWSDRLERYWEITGVRLSEEHAREIVEVFGLPCWTGWGSKWAPRVRLPLCGLCGVAGRSFVDGEAFGIEGKVCNGCREELVEELAMAGGMR